MTSSAEKDDNDRMMVVVVVICSVIHFTVDNLYTFKTVDYLANVLTDIFTQAFLNLSHIK